MQVSEIKVSFSNGVKKEEYGAIKKAEVTLTAVVPDAQDGHADAGTIDEAASYLDQIAQLAQDKVNEMLNLLPPAAERFAAAAATGAAAMIVEPAAAPAEKPKRQAKAKETPPAADAAQVTDGAEVVEDPAAPADATATAVDPSAITDEWDTGGAVVEITDADLNAACQKRSGEGIEATKIKAVIATFNPDPTKVFALREIAAAQRQDFLTKLAALTK